LKPASASPTHPRHVDERGINCSGMFVRAFRRQGASIYHGSNTIFRKYLARSGTIASAAGLRPGMAGVKGDTLDGVDTAESSAELKLLFSGTSFSQPQ